VEATADTGAVRCSQAAGGAAGEAVEDPRLLQLLSSGPRLVSANQPTLCKPGSSIMPGKVNPVIPEVVRPVVLHDVGGDVTVADGSGSGAKYQLDDHRTHLSAYRGISTLTNACTVLRRRCIGGSPPTVGCVAIRGNPSTRDGARPVLSYEASTEIARDTLATGRVVWS
jgi:aspartate ammonia-lyase